jgi:hypothetical protein
VSLFSPPWGPKEGLATPQFLYAADPSRKSEDTNSVSSTDEGPSQRPYETLSALAAKLGLKIETKYSKKHYDQMVKLKRR